MISVEDFRIGGLGQTAYFMLRLEAEVLANLHADDFLVWIEEVQKGLIETSKLIMGLEGLSSLDFHEKYLGGQEDEDVRLGIVPPRSILVSNPLRRKEYFSRELAFQFPDNPPLIGLAFGRSSLEFRFLLERALRGQVGRLKTLNDMT
jgi:hypothetical protein